MDSDSKEGLCGEKLVSEFYNFHEICMKILHDYAEEVSKTNSLQKRLGPKPIVISNKQHIISENYLSLKKELKRKLKKFNW